MTPDKVSGIALALPPLSTAKSNSSLQEEKATRSLNASEVLSKDSRLAPVDTINISHQSRQAITDVKKEETPIAQVKKEEANRVNNGVKYDLATAKVQFVYDLKGNVSVRFMDSTNRLIYQVPSELMLSMAEAASKSGLPVDTKA